MTENQKEAILNSGKEYFRKIIIPNHLKNLDNLQLRKFNINPFLVNYPQRSCVETQSRNRSPRLLYIHVFLPQV